MRKRASSRVKIPAKCAVNLTGRTNLDWRATRGEPMRTGIGRSPDAAPRGGAIHSPHHRHRAAEPRATRRRELFLATSKVEDFDRWMNVFSTTSLEKRKQHGSKGSHVFR